LLDINMPGMDGYEVCQRLKENARLAEIPVIFVSALNETIDKVKAFSAGGVDYVTKPFQMEEVLARISTHLELCRRKRELEESYERLRKLEALRDNLVHMIVHDMRSPLQGISGYLELLSMVESHRLSEDGRSYIQDAQTSVESLIEMVSSVLDVSKMESGQMQINPVAFDLIQIAGEVLKKLAPLKGGLDLVEDMPEGSLQIVADPDLISRTIQNLLTNALKFTPKGGRVRLEIKPVEGGVRVALEDTGCGIPAEDRERIFEKFGQIRGQHRKHSTGLGLTFCKLAVEAHGGTFGVESEVGAGSTFWFRLPG
jgi:two-component system, sensor histidine kinase and response regulator